jgi:peptidoglycan/xylan/chitin deacetylase (PgdA/CDA1 family)
MRSRLRDIWRRVTPPSWRGAVVLLYHRIGPADVDPWRLAVTPEHFSEHLDILRRSAHTITVEDLRVALDDGRIPARTVAITFDDGYADLVSEALPRLDRADLRATAFVVSHAIGRDREFWWDEVERALLGPEIPRDPLRLEITDRPTTIDPSATGSRGELHRRVWAIARALPPDRRDALAAAVLQWAGLTLTPRPARRTLTSDEFDVLANSDRVEIEAHTADHAWLAGLDEAELTSQIESGRSEIERRLRRPVRSLAYPHGGPDDIGAAPSIARQAGFQTAFMATGGTVRKRADRMRLPRIFVDDVDGEGFARLLWRRAGIRAS